MIGKAYDDFDKDCVRVHNQLRALHNASALCWSESLARDAQKWAESLAYRDRAEHDYQDLITKGQGENIAWMANAVDKCQGAVKKPGCITCGDIVKKWYSEEKNYDFQKAAPTAVGQTIRHFNQAKEPNIFFVLILVVLPMAKYRSRCKKMGRERLLKKCRLSTSMMRLCTCIWGLWPCLSIKDWFRQSP